MSGAKLGRRIVKGTLVLGAGQAGSRFLGLLRNGIVARLLKPADFGVGAMFAVTEYFFDLTTSLSPETLLVQAKDGDEPEMQASLHGILAIRGIVLAVLVFLAAPLVASIFNSPHIVDSFRMLALIPIVRGFMHTDLTRYQRSMRFAPRVTFDLATDLALLACAWPAAKYFDDYRALLSLTILKAVINLIASHWLAERPYRWRFDKAMTQRLMHFGWPLLANGLLLFGIQYGDQLLIGKYYDVHDLGLFSAAVGITAAMAATTNLINRQLVLPILSDVQDLDKDYGMRYRRSMQVLFPVACSFAVGFLCFGDFLVRVAYGPQFSQSVTVVGVIAVMHAVRLMRSTTTHAAFAKGDTRQVLIANLFRISLMIPALFAAMRGAPMYFVVVASMVGESVALVVDIARLKVKQNLPIAYTARPLLGLGVIVGVVAFVRANWFSGAPWQEKVALGVAFILVIFGLSVAAFGWRPWRTFESLRRV